jgi:dihydroorotase
MTKPEDLYIKNVLIADSASEFCGERRDILIKDGHYLIDERPDLKELREIDGSALVLLPGVFDFQVNCGEPGHEDNETFKSLSDAAINGGVTGMLVMPSDTPPSDNRGQIEFKQRLSAGLSTDFRFAGYISQKGEGKNLAELHDMHLGGAVAFTDNKLATDHSLLVHLSIQYNAISGGLLMFHPEDSGLRLGGVIHESAVSVALGMKGAPSIAEETAVNKLLTLAEYHGRPLHISGISSRNSVRMIEAAKLKGIPVSCSVYVQNLFFCDEDLLGFDSVYKVWPPLRGKEDREALIDAVKSGIIDIVCSDHTPSCIEKKEVEFAYAAYGMAGTETLLQALLTVLGSENINLISSVICHNPRKMLQLGTFEVKKNGKADFVLINTIESELITKDKLKSQGVNNPFEGRMLLGKIAGTYTNGRWFQRS